MKRILFAMIAFAALAGSASAVDTRSLFSEDAASCTGSPKPGDPS
ncbi:hypothetical protein [Noviherbaspirillum malthae]|jgi:hypothetical protein|nr:hypothetical protein [Noviherbaspirillum malthae]